MGWYVMFYSSCTLVNSPFLICLAGETKGVGGYCEYTLADDRICFKLPAGISPAQGSTVPLAAATAWLAFFSRDCLGIDRSHGSSQTVLVWGGSCT